MLHCHRVNPQTVTNTELPTLVFVHGLLGSGEDWNACLPYLTRYSCITVDLPGHGNSRHIEAESFEETTELLTDSLAACIPGTCISSSSPVVFVGYSMGARIIMNAIAKGAFSQLNVLGAIIEGGNFGLSTEDEKSKRLENDIQWANRFISQPIAQVLNDWYQQAVFSSLNHEQRQTLIAKRSANLGSGVGKMLLATSLAKQDNLLPVLNNQSVPLFYICGEKDTKFTQLAQQSGLDFEAIANAGHNVHHEQPEAFALRVQSIIQEWLK